MSKYLLYVGDIKEISVGYIYLNAAREQKYMLVYSQQKPEGDFKTVPEEKYEQFLDLDELNWLRAIQLEINKQFIKENEELLKSVLNDFADQLERNINERTARNGSQTKTPK